MPWVIYVLLGAHASLACKQSKSFLQEARCDLQRAREKAALCKKQCTIAASKVYKVCLLIFMVYLCASAAVLSSFLHLGP